MIYLMYTSVATKPFSEDELTELLTQSKANNQSQGITGLLLYREGLFMQLLEGPEEAVHDCYRRICADPRHKDILLLLEKSSSGRLFGHWAMAFEKVENAFKQQEQLQPKEQQLEQQDLEGFSPFLSQPFSTKELGNEFNEGLFLLLSFKKNVPLKQHHKGDLPPEE
ncbi:MAG: BLUF domain-containing protein [Proteobacteria bacterium]|nr:MAG: BLUF domain-containing protein [Pseudomonadota bacterium]